MSKNYPLISDIRIRKKNTCAKCKCGEIGRFKVTIQTSFMRGEDDVVWSCEEHKRDVNYLYFDQPEEARL